MVGISSIPINFRQLSISGGEIIIHDSSFGSLADKKISIVHFGVVSITSHVIYRASSHSSGDTMAPGGQALLSMENKAKIIA